MGDVLDRLLGSLCHRSGDYPASLSLCLRCSAVYAGFLAGLVFEACARGVGRRSPGRAALALSGLGFVLMAVVGIGGLYGVIQAPAVVKAWTGFYFGAAIAGCTSVALLAELGAPAARSDGTVPARLVLLLVFGVWAWALSVGDRAAFQALAAAAGAGIPATFALVNLALSLVVLRPVRGVGLRMALAAGMAVLLTLAEAAAFALWRRAW